MNEHNISNLTAFSSSGGCGCKLDPDYLKKIIGESGREVFSKNLTDYDEIEITFEDYGLKMVKTIKQENYNTDTWDKWVLFSRKIYDNMNKVLTGN